MLRDELDAEFDAELLERKLWGMQMLTFPCTLSLPECDRVRWHLFPEIRLPTQAGLFQSDETNEEPLVPNLLQVMDVYQERVARTLGEGHRVIHGPAGSGKTMILIFRAQHLANAARPDHPVLVLCYNRALARHIDAALRHRGVDERVVVYTFHAWCETLVRTYQIAVTTPRNHPDYFDALAQSVIRAVDMGLVPDGQYLSLLVDEAHDFDDAWLRVAARMVSAKTRSLLVLYDDAQSIYRKGRRRINFSKLGIEAARRRTSILKINYRNTAEILTLAMRCAEGWLTEQVECEDAPPRVVPASAGRHGPQPVLIRAADVVEEAALLEQRIARALSDGLSPSDILVLARERAQLTPLTHRLRQRGIPIQSLAFDDARGIDFRESAVRLMTLHGSKGLECAWVAILGLQAMPNRHASLEDEARLLYVGMTRATQQLVLAASGESAMVARVRQALEGIGALRPELPFAVSLD
jgi:superfamily I DNA/RNA helicase